MQAPGAYVDTLGIALCLRGCIGMLVVGLRWEVATGKERRSFAGHSLPVRWVAFSPDGRMALSGCEDTTLNSTASGNSVSVAVPSPLAGEGCSVCQRDGLGEGSGLNPSPIRACGKSDAALSRKGRGRNNGRRSSRLHF